MQATVCQSSEPPVCRRTSSGPDRPFATVSSASLRRFHLRPVCSQDSGRSTASRDDAWRRCTVDGSALHPLSLSFSSHRIAIDALESGADPRCSSLVRQRLSLSTRNPSSAFSGDPPLKQASDLRSDTRLETMDGATTRSRTTRLLRRIALSVHSPRELSSSKQSRRMMAEASQAPGS